MKFNAQCYSQVQKKWASDHRGSPRAHYTSIFCITLLDGSCVLFLTTMVSRCFRDALVAPISIEAFSDDFAQKVKMDGKQRALPSFIKYYLGFQDSSTCAERSLGRMTKYDQQSGPLEQDGVTLSGLLQVDLDGPQQIEDLAKRSIINEDAASRNVFLEPTTFSLGAARIWKEHHGRRFNLYKQCKDHGQKKLAKKHGTAGSSRRAQGQSCW